ncbi:hypothetical protein [Marinobacter sp. M5B]|uniref:hypothetical protein n=1 Tax=Marinobacter sp. M5B TaxID=3141535 RepID=UPI0036D23F89
MSNQLKLKTLLGVLSALEDPVSHRAKLKKKSLFLALTAWVGFLFSFVLYFQDFKGLYLPFIASFSGILYGLSMYLDSAVKQWPVVAKHVDIESLRAEVEQLKT